jgi:hypothetical protein
MLQGSGRSRVIACHSREVGNILLLLWSCYSHMECKYIWIIIGDRARLCFWIGFGPSWQMSEAQVASVPPVSIKDRSLHWISGQVTEILSWAHTYLWERKDLLLSCHGFRLFPDRLLGVGFRWRSKHHTETGPVVLGAWSPSLDGDLDPLDRSEMGWSCLCLGCKWGVCFRGTQLGILIRESPFLRDGTTWLHSGTVVRTERWKMKGWFWWLNPCLKVE